MTSHEETEHCEGCGNDDGPAWCEGAFTDRWLKFTKASLREGTRGEAERILSTLTLDDLYGLMYVSHWVQTVVGRHIMLYEEGSVPRYDGQRPEGHQD